MNYHPIANPYAPTLGNVLSRCTTWLRGMVRRHRRGLLMTLAAAATLGVAVNASTPPVKIADPVLARAH